MDGLAGRPYDPRANYFELKDLEKNLPRVENLTCGGNILHVTGETIMKTSGRTPVPCWTVETLDRHNTPTLDWLKARPWLITTAVQLGGSDGRTPMKFPQGNLPDGSKPGVLHPLVCDPVTYPIIAIEKWRCVEWTDPNPPDPYKVYLPI